MSPGAWVTQGQNLPSIPIDADFVIAEVEGESDYQGVMASLPSLDRRPKALVTTFDGLLAFNADGSVNGPASRARCKPLNDAGFDIQTEFYLSSLQGDATPGHLEFVARTHCGFTGNVAPVFGIYGGYSLDDYAKFANTVGWGVWLAEFLP